MDNGIYIKTGEIISIFDIKPKQNGKKCNCVCIECHRPLIARTLGTKQRKCFAHTKNDEKACRKIREQKKFITTERHAKDSPETTPTCINKYKTLIEIWNEVQAPFIAKCKDKNYYFGIRQKPFDNKYNRCYGFVAESITGLYNQKKYNYNSNGYSREIFLATNSIWEFLRLF